MPPLTDTRGASKQIVDVIQRTNIFLTNEQQRRLDRRAKEREI